MKTVSWIQLKSYLKLILNCILPNDIYAFHEISTTPNATKTTPTILVVVKDSPNRITERTATIEIAPQVSTG